MLNYVEQNEAQVTEKNHIVIASLCTVLKYLLTFPNTAIMSNINKYENYKSDFRVL